MTGVPGYMALMYHELLADGQRPFDDSPGYLRYVLSRDEFRHQLEHLAEAGMTGLPLGQIVAEPARQVGGAAVAITFDDGCASDLEHAAPLLTANGFGATFFVVAGFLSRPGYLTPGGVRELVANGFEVGSHGLTHTFLSSLAESDLVRELTDSRARLEDITGCRVDLLSCPGGRWSPAVARAARTAGYRIVATSSIGLNTPHTPAERIRRLAIRPGLPLSRFLRYCRGHGLWPQRLRAGLLRLARQAVGEHRYQALQQRTRV